MRDLVDDFVEHEYNAFPVGLHDDMLDALARLFEPDMTLVWPKEKKDVGYSLPREDYAVANGWMGA
jgi:hypothetical protein